MPRVATVGRRPIPRSRLDRRVAEMRRGPRGRHMPPDDGPGSVAVRAWVVRELVTEEILAQEARAAGIAVEGRTGRPSTAAIARLVDRVAGSVSISDADVRAYYERNADGYARPEARRVVLVTVTGRVGARDAAERVAVGENVGEVIELRRGELAGPLEDAIFGAEVGEIVGPMRTEHGWHVAQILEVIPRSVIPLAEARPAIEAELLAAARARAFDEWLERRRQALAVLEPGFEHPGHPVHGIASHRH